LVLTPLPEKQGLKLKYFAAPKTELTGINATSRKTRIETYQKQNHNQNHLRSINATSRKTRIETALQKQHVFARSQY